jgi:DnaJ family protein B protein 4
LEELYTGCTKKLKVQRRLVSSGGGSSEKILTVQVRAGWKSGTKIKFPGEGDEISPGIFQDIEFVIQQKTHPVYERKGDDLHTKIQVDIGEALVGFKRSITTLDGRELLISHNNVTQPGQEMSFPARGMPNQKNESVKGNLVVTVNVSFPASLTANQKHLILQAFPPKNH